MPKKEHGIWMHPSQGLKRHLETLSKLSIEFPLAMYGRSFSCLGPSFFLLNSRSHPLHLPTTMPNGFFSDRMTNRRQH